MGIRFPGGADISVLRRNQTAWRSTLSHGQFTSLAASRDRNMSTKYLRLMPWLEAQGDIQQNSAYPD
jgi:hypothetical protein